jgi:hypothetical protein
MRLSLAILYTPATGKPLRIANIANQALLLAAATSAIAEAEFRAEQVGLADRELGRVERAEADRLKNILGLLLNEASAQSEAETAAPVM